jgi:cytosine/adenosine deaminase-related metal-dependent hydrolase
MGGKDMGASSPDVEAALARRAVYQRRAAFSSAPVVHPERTEFIIRRACLLTMDPHIGDLAAADLHVRDGLIVNVGRDLQATAMHEIDGRNAVAVPGFVAAHRHLCTAALADTAWSEANTPGSRDGEVPDLSSANAADVYCVVRLALLEALAAGVTTLNHCAYDIGGEHAETAIVAQIDSGMRGRFSYPLGGPSADGSDERDTLNRLEREWFASHGDHLLDLGIAVDSAAVDPLAALPALPHTVNHTDAVTPHDALAERTRGAARTLELDHCIGSLAPGKCADIVLIAADTRSDSAPLLPQRGYDMARRATAADVLLVAVDGRLRKQNGVLTEPNEGLIRREGQDAITRLRAEARWPPIDT